MLLCFINDGGTCVGERIPSFLHFLLLCGFFILSIFFLVFSYWRLGGGLMVKEIVFDVERKMHCVPWKYGRCFVFVLFCPFTSWYMENAKYWLIYKSSFFLHTWLLEMVGLNPRQQHKYAVTHKKKLFQACNKHTKGSRRVCYKEGKLYTITHIMLEKVQN
jgi:hypothetical protein